jgi:hypothetical protein
VVSARLPDIWPDGIYWYFKQVLEGTEVCDYAVASIENDAHEIALGYVSDTANCISPDANAVLADVEYQSRIILHRLGEIQLPIDVVISFDDGQTIIENWDGKDRSTDFSYSGTSRIVSAEIDPERKIYLDMNFLNNSKTASVQRTGLNYYFTKYLANVQHLMETLSLLM